MCRPPFPPPSICLPCFYVFLLTERLLLGNIIHSSCIACIEHVSVSKKVAFATFQNECFWLFQDEPTVCRLHNIGVTESLASENFKKSAYVCGFQEYHCAVNCSTVHLRGEKMSSTLLYHVLASLCWTKREFHQCQAFITFVVRKCYYSEQIWFQCNKFNVNKFGYCLGFEYF